MKLEHAALWTHQIETLKDFYTRWLGASSGEKYTSDKGKRGQFTSYFLSFGPGARLEIMQLPAIPQGDNAGGFESTGLTHLAFSTETPKELDALYARMQSEGIPIASVPRVTGDGSYEFCALDPDGNRIEITTAPKKRRIPGVQVIEKHLF